MLNNSHNSSSNRQEESWNIENEKLLKAWKKECDDRNTQHDLSGYYYKKLTNWFSIPPIIVNLFMSAFTTKLTQSPHVDLILTFWFVVAGIFSAVNVYFNFAQRQEKHFFFSVLYEEVSRDIRSQLTKKHKYRCEVDLYVQKIEMKMQQYKLTEPVIPLKFITTTAMQNLILETDTTPVADACEAVIVDNNNSQKLTLTL